MSKKASHPGPHQYQLTKLGKDKSYTVFRCVKPQCSHFIEPTLLPGREAECPICLKTYILNTNHKRIVRPHCLDCKSRGTTKVVATPVRARTAEELAADFKRKFGN